MPPAAGPPDWRRALVIAGAVILVVVVGAGIALGGGGRSDSSATATTLTSAPTTVIDGATVAPTTTTRAAATATATTLSIDEPGSLWWVVNRQRPLPGGYVPDDLVIPDVPFDPQSGVTHLSLPAAQAFEAMVADAATAGFRLQLNSGYRSQEQQQRLYDRNVEDYGQEVADQRVALPGTSEHQTGLAVDVGEVGLPLDEVFGDTASARWVQDNAHRFGLIVRYPPDKAAITGYANEPWHLRYVGVELASILHADGLTMEEFFHLPPAGRPG